MARRRQSNSRRAKSQQRLRLRRTLFKGAHKYACECNADTCVIIRTREDGKTFYFITDTFENFLPIRKELVRICYSSFATEKGSLQYRNNFIHRRLRRHPKTLILRPQIGPQILHATLRSTTKNIEIEVIGAWGFPAYFVGTLFPIGHWILSLG
jgi:hypothetical protein